MSVITWSTLRRVGKTVYPTTALICLSLFINPGTAPAYAAEASGTYSVYLYDSNGIPVDSTNCCSYDEGHIFDSVGQAIGSYNLNDSFAIYNAAGDMIGYFAIPAPLPPA